MCSRHWEGFPHRRYRVYAWTHLANGTGYCPPPCVISNKFSMCWVLHTYWQGQGPPPWTPPPSALKQPRPTPRATLVEYSGQRT